MDKKIIDALLTAMIRSGEGVSDLLFVAGKPPLIENHGGLVDFPIDTPGSVLAPAHIEQIATHLINGNARSAEDFAKNGSCDCSYVVENVARFRVNVFRQNGRHAIVLRKLQTAIPTLDQLGVEPVFREMIREKTGIIFVTGGTGSGKTTTLAAMLNELNQTQAIHIVTLEDPIEFLHPHAAAAISQRELGKDFPDFATGLRAALRQAPKVILVGEIRDRETMEIALTASETGHLVFSTLHTINAGQTINRILGLFTVEEEQQLRQRLADTLRYVVSQRLVQKIGGGRLLVNEIMGSNLRTREAILYGESENRSFQDIIEAGVTLGWHSFDQSIITAFQAGKVDDDTAMIFSTNKSRMRREIDALHKANGELADQPSGLKLREIETPPPVMKPRPVAMPDGSSAGAGMSSSAYPSSASAYPSPASGHSAQAGFSAPAGSPPAQPGH